MGLRWCVEAALEVLDTLILRRLVSQEMVRLGMDVTNEELDASITDIASRNGMEISTLRGEVDGKLPRTPALPFPATCTLSSCTHEQDR